MKLNGLTPTLWVEDIAETIAFYCDVLSFECTNQMEGWACMVRDQVEVMISLPNQHEGFIRSQFTGSFYFHTDDVDGLWKQLKDKDKVALVYPIENFHYGMREFAIRSARNLNSALATAC